ncbi:hypothetical protein Caci_3162 [Catenulispora acidiphila DSM 44928]|uniref:Shedu protein SduA C-terminal domain-containing protein n=1 Tax=Catenulispora acidiphila (strain DSM 44928 / JCM 14897 / NBRC 102108 / NRRL B-24433 / ID139908) TaxID=479433 RepID=C7Q665_CATAD|nr:Shedu immune nuclease family protein [Catenulispora acidiphila]ACU72071.1 hypothetical protein Caci_3162 [Catenulispora acidiphila DSM 44928]
MGFRSGFTLVRFLTAAREMTSEDLVRHHIDAALAYTNSDRSKYQRGRPLVNHIEAASRAAAAMDDNALAERLAGCAEYAAGTIHLTLLETRWDPEARASHEKYMRLNLEVGLVRCAEILDEYLKDQPHASGHEMHQWLVHVTGAMGAWTIGEGRLPRVKLPRYSAEHLAWFRDIRLVLNEQPDSSDLTPEIAEQLANVPGAELVARAVQWHKRKGALDRLRAVVEDPASSEKEIHAELKQQAWIFGGRYVDELTRRRLTTFDELDIPLIRGDGSLHVVELKKANQRKLVTSTRSHCAVGSVVHDAVMQAANYLRSLDENRAAILADHGIECRRASATVLIGHPAFVEEAFRANEISAALRTYNTVLNRIEVMTYAELIDAAERSLALNDAEM